MKYLLLIPLFIMGCRPQNTPATHDTVPKQETENFQWLLGDWERIGEEKPNQTFEFWSQIDSLRYEGLGFTMNNNDTIWKETIGLYKRGEDWVFDVTGQGDTTSTPFVLTQIDSLYFRCENPDNEFPKKIEYRFVEDQIHAVISEGGPTIPFHFKRLGN